MEKAVITEYFDGNDYSAEFDEYVKRGHCTVEWKFDFMFDVHRAVAKDEKRLAGYSVVSESAEIDCPDGFREMALAAAAGGGSLYVDSTEEGPGRELWLSTKRFIDAWRVRSENGDSPKIDMSKCHLGTKISYGGFCYWVACSFLLTDVLVAKGALAKGSYGDHASAGGWMMEERQQWR